MARTFSGALVPAVNPDGSVQWQGWQYEELLAHLNLDLDLSTNESVPTSFSGTELGYAEVTANVIISSTVAPGTTVVTGPNILVDGKPILTHFFCPLVQPAAVAGTSVTFFLYEGATLIAQLGTVSTPAAGFNDIPTSLFLRWSPVPGIHQYIVTGQQSGGNATAAAGTGVVGATRIPLFVRFTKV